MRCLNCGNTYKGNFCPHCGQKASTKRLRLSEALKNMIGPFVGGDNKFMRTCRDLFLRPGHLTRKYLLGKRIVYYHPLQMFVYVLTVYAVVSFFLGSRSSIFDEMTSLNFKTSELDEDYAFIRFVLNSVNKITTNKLYCTISLALFSVPCSRWIFRKYTITRPDGQKLALNHTEQFYAQIYQSCISILISIILLPLCLIDGISEVVASVYKAITMFYSVFLYKQMLGIKWWKSILLTVVGTLMTVLLFLFVLMTICFIAAVVDGNH